MTDKQNATINRPEGERIINAPLLMADLKKFRDQIQSETAWKDSDRNAITVFKSDNVTITIICLHAGAEVKPHVAEGDMSLQVLDGSVKMSTIETNVELEEYQLAAIHKGLTYSLYAKKESTLLLTITNVD